MISRLAKRFVICRRGMSSNSSKTLRESVREFGPLAVGVYCSISFSVFCACLASITFFKIDINRIQDWIYHAKKYVGFDPQKPDLVDNTTTTLGTQILLAIALSKLFVPIKLGLTAGLTPILARKLRYYGFNLSAKGGYKDASNQVKQKFKNFKDQDQNIP